MIYYKLPTFNNNIRVNPKQNKYKCNPFISKSVHMYCTETINYIITECLHNNLEKNNLEYMTSISNSHGYICSNIPDTGHAISKLKPYTNLFYELLEIISVTKVLDEFNKKSINMLHIVNSCESIESVEYINAMNNNNANIHNTHFLKMSEYINNKNNIQFDFMFFEQIKYDNNDVNKYIINFVEIIMAILTNQQSGGSCLIKVNYIFHKPIVDLLYLLNTLFEKIYIIKPSVSNASNSERFVLCTKFTSDKNKINMCKQNHEIFLNLLNNIEDDNIISIIDFNLPCYFLNKVNDINLIIGQQQLESLNQIINILKSKSQNEKLEQLQKNNIQKAILWCDKHMVPHNKMVDKMNCFLNSNNHVNIFDKDDSVEFISEQCI